MPLYCGKKNNDAVKTKDLYLGGQKIAYAFLGAKNSNCLTYIPQDIKFEIVDGTTPTLYAGSEVWVPYGTAAPELSIGDTRCKTFLQSQI